MKSIFDQTTIGNLKLKNRLFRSATCENLADGNHLTKEALKLYEDLAAGGVGTIIISATSVEESENTSSGLFGIYDDSFIEEYKNLTAIIHKHSANAIMQLAYFGSFTAAHAENKKVWGPSAVKNLITDITPEAMTKDEIKHLQQSFADAALRAKSAGFDGVQIHAAHSFPLNQFLSPYYNRRTDEYGGAIENRARMVLETYAAIREKVGPDYPILVKINSSDSMEGGMTFEDCKYVCEKLDKVGISAIEISGMWFLVNQRKESYYKDFASELAKELNAPIILTGGNRDYNSLTDLLNQTGIEYFALSRPFIAEPDLVNRWENGDYKRSKCFSCNACASFNAKTGVKCIFLNKESKVKKIVKSKTSYFLFNLIGKTSKLIFNLKKR